VFSIAIFLLSDFFPVGSEFLAVKYAKLAVHLLFVFKKRKKKSTATTATTTTTTSTKAFYSNIAFHVTCHSF